MITHENERIFDCPKCNKSFTRKAVLRNHLAFHSDVRKYSCPFCPKKFKTSSELVTHRNIHTGMYIP